MIKKTKPAILLLISLIYMQDAYGQAHVNITDYLSKRFTEYCKSVPREEMYIHFDREEYISGENLWFNMYVLDRQSCKPSVMSEIGYFELLNPENRPVVQKRIRIDHGSGPGQIVLPDTLSTGTYTIRAYTSWMKNFLPYNCFIKNIKIYNVFNNNAFNRKLGSVKSVYNESFNGTGKLADKTGLTLNADNTKPDIVEIVVKAGENYRSVNNNLFYLFIQTHGKIDRVSAERIGEADAKIVIPKALLTSGINQITLFDSGGKPICEKYIFTPDKAEQFFTVISPDTISTRSNLLIGIGNENKSSAVLNEANLSISVYPETNVPHNMDLKDYMIFGTEFGIQPYNTFKNRKVSQLPSGVMDSLLLSIKSNWIDWGTILSGNLPYFRYSPERECHYLTGKLLERDQKPAGSDEIVILSSPGEVAAFQYDKTDKNGNFKFDIPVGEELKDLVIQPNDVSKNQSVKIESPFYDQYFQSQILIDSADNIIPPHISKWSANYQVNKIYGTSGFSARLNKSGPIIKTKRFYGRPDVEIVMADYIKLPVMQEVFFELIPGVPLKKKKAGFEFSVIDPVDKTSYEIPPCLMIDGVIIRDPSQIASLDPELVGKIDVVRERYFVGDYQFYGIINVISKDGNFSCVPMPDYAIRFPYRVIDPVSSFVSPDYSTIDTRNNHIPDFRNTLYWNPAMRPDKNGKAGVEFWTSDFASVYEIDIQGMTSEGKIISLRKKIRVEKNF